MIAIPPTTAGVSGQSYQAYMLRRLSAVPDIPIFHQGGDDGWIIDYGFTGEEGLVSVCIETAVRPLPLLGVLPALLGSSDGAGNIVLRAEVVERMRPAWLEGDYDDWSSLWD